MRLISSTDKLVIQSILKLSSYGFTLSDLFDKFIPGDLYLKVFEDENATKLSGIRQFRLFVGFDSESDYHQLFARLFHLNETFEFLIKENLIKVIGENKFNSLIIHPELEKKYKISYIFNDQPRFDLFSKFFYKFQATEALSELVKNRYLTNAEKIANRSSNIAKVAVVATIVSAFCAVYTIVNSNAFHSQIDQPVGFKKSDSSDSTSNDLDAIK